MPEPILKDNSLESRIFASRLLLALFVVVSLLATLLARYYYLQVSQYEIYTTQSDRNRVHVQPVPPKRGLIYDRNGLLLAENQPSYNLTLVKERVVDMDATLLLLQELLGIQAADIEKFKKRLPRHRPFKAAPLKFKLTEKEIAVIAVNRYRLPGVDVTAQLMRNYPFGELYAHSVGYVGRINEKEQQSIDQSRYVGTDHIGKLGLEKYYEDLLHGEVGYEHVETNARGRVQRVLEHFDPIPGQDLTLFIDSKVQRVAHDALGEERGAVVAMDPKTGGVIAIVSTPAYDTNLFVSGISSKDYSRLRDSIDLPLFNRSLQGQYPPASTIKPMLGLAGLDYAVITDESVVADPGWYKLPNDDRKYRDWTWQKRRSGHSPWVNLHQAIVESCDTFYFDLAYKLGVDRIYEFGDKFGLGQKTQVDLTDERKGLLPSREWKRQMYRLPWFPGETLNIGIGQGYMLTTPIQLALVTSMIAGRGKAMRPRLLKSVDGVDRPPVPMPEVKLADEASWDSVIAAMRDVVHSRKGTARRIRLKAPYKMGGKTGTAQVVGMKQDERYDAETVTKRNRDHALFIGFAPLEDPKIVVAVIVENGMHGSSAAAPIARKVFDAYLLAEQKK